VTRPTIHRKPLPYASALQVREPGGIELAVVHCTELPDLDTAREFGERILYPDSVTGNSGHYYIERSGRIEEWVPPRRVAHHVRGYNARSVGIELVNIGRFPDWFDSRRQQMTEPYPPMQIDALISLLRELTDALPGLRWIAGHETLDTERVPASDDPQRQVCRKLDPGPMFPWTALLENIGLEYLQGEALASFRTD
jgi:N-acetylmuramoyl-L-alanine amidase